MKIPLVTVSRLKKLAFVLLAVVAGFGGAWLYDVSSFGQQNDSTMTENRARVIAEGEVVAEIASEVSPSTVSIVVQQTRQSSWFGPLQQEGAGTGIIISKDGYVLTNKHVIPENTSSVSVVANDGTTYENVEVVGRDPINDIAFLKIPKVNDLKPAVLGDSSNLVVGSRVVAIGNALGEFQTTVTSGIISGIDRSIVAGDMTSSEQLSNLIQTDAAINPGNSGGPLVNIAGEVIGINTAVSQGAEGIGFAIPINEARGLINGVLANGKVERAYLGVRYVMLNAEVAKFYNVERTRGALIIGSEGGPAIASDSPADRAGLRSEDIIIKVNDVELGRTVTLVSQLSKFSPGDKIKLTILRSGEEQTLDVTLDRFDG